ncbi:FAD-dependent oxidoreductase [Telmatospirillum sp.]|uniref:NAD(P)/FAD-dependent oxidoreductase n=1 Tax=Telmatospirillum sp. TaxID=2079197 RepID=UPI0028510A0F|nr:FAD-dependent oxidoreductase [Telmatospirillum sp.]MDR3440971.1 FAD-dependent oxidoreductase [Telmatospirillum sp.]
MPMQECDIAVVGAGIIGAAAADHLAGLGYKVVVIDRAEPGAGTSGACDGYVSVSTKVPGVTLELAAESQRLWRDLAAELGRDIGYSAPGGLLIAETEIDPAALEAQAAMLRNAGVIVELRDRAGLLELEPNFGPRVQAALFCPGEAHVTAYLATQVLAARAAERGVRHLWRTAVEGVLHRGQEVAALDLRVDGERLHLQCRQVLLAAGLGSRDLGPLLGLPVPIKPRRGDLVVTERLARPLIHRFCASARYLVAKGNPAAAEASADPLERLGHGFVIESTPERQQIIGSTRIFRGDDTSSDIDIAAMIVREAVARVPALAGVPILRSFSGLRPFVPDRRPIIGRSRIVPNLLVATGHEGDGVTLAPITARLIGDLAQGRDPGTDLAKFDPDRFAD